jgi:hypothetical protein
MKKIKAENRIYGKPVFYPPNGTGRDYWIILNNGGLTQNVKEMRKTPETLYIEGLRTDFLKSKVGPGFIQYLTTCHFLSIGSSPTILTTFYKSIFLI